MALHTGEVKLEDGEYHGPALHRASRMLTAAHGGQIWAAMGDFSGAAGTNLITPLYMAASADGSALLLSVRASGEKGLLLKSADVAFSLPITALIIFGVVSVLAGVVAAVGPARRAGRLNVLRALQWE